jgi:hypothetical protein
VAKPPSSKQLGYLKRLGYKGTEPTSSKQASAAIEVMLESKDSKAAERAVTKQRKAEEKREKQARKDRLQTLKEEIRFMVRENRAYGGEGLYAGFVFVEVEDERPSEDDEPYIGAFVPLKVAQQHPELLLRETLDYEEVLSDDKLPRGTRMVVAPGRFKQLQSSSGCLGVLLVFAAGLAALAARV